jgi:hypothetical protein
MQTAFAVIVLTGQAQIVFDYTDVLYMAVTEGAIINTSGDSMRFLRQAPEPIVGVGDGLLQRVGALDQLTGRIKGVVMGLAVKVGARQDAPGRVVGKAVSLGLFRW